MQQAPSEDQQTAPALASAAPAPPELKPSVPTEKPNNIPATGHMPTAKIALNPISANKAATLIPSLTDLERIANGEDNNEPKYIIGDARDPFTYEQLLACWNQYAAKAKDDGKINVYTLLTSSDPVLDSPEEITVQVEHKIQESQIQAEMIDFLNFLRPALKNYSINIKTKQVVRAVVNRLYTNTERYQYLVEKNPKLEEMRKRFNLDVNS